MQEAEIQKKIKDTIATQMDSEEIKTKIAENTEAQVQKAIADAMASDEVKNKISSAVKQLSNAKSQLDTYNVFYLGIADYTAGVAQAATGAGTLAKGMDDLYAGSSNLLDGTKQVKGGSEKLYSGTGDLKDGTDTLIAGTTDLSDGADQLYNGANELNGNMPTLKEGIEQLTNGSKELSDGLKQFNDEAVKKIIDFVDGDLDLVVNRLSAIKDVANNYSFMQKYTNAMGSNVQFIYKSDSIKEN